jgi:hypothetical protein
LHQIQQLLQQQQPLQGLLQPVTQTLGGLLGAGQQGQQEQQPGLPVKQSNTRGLLQRTGKVYD